MSLVVSQNWDGVTPPAIPAGWNVAAQLTTSASQFVSSPNSLGLTSGSGGTRYFGTYGTDDGSGAAAVSINLSTAVKFAGGGVAADYQGGLTWRGSASTLNAVNTIFYAAYLDANLAATDSLVFGKMVNGTFTSIASVTLTGTYGTGWFTISLGFTGGGGGTNATQVSVQRQSDGFWLNSSGSFQSGQTVALTSSNNDITSGGFAGLVAAAASANKTWLDDWSLNSGTIVVWSAYLVNHRLPVAWPDNRRYWL